MGGIKKEKKRKEKTSYAQKTIANESRQIERPNLEAGAFWAGAQRRHHAQFSAFSWVLTWLGTMIRKVLTIAFATWPSMHDPVSHLLNAANGEEADKLTEKWTKGKLKELEFVGITVRMEVFQPPENLG